MSSLQQYQPCIHATEAMMADFGETVVNILE